MTRNRTIVEVEHFMFPGVFKDNPSNFYRMLKNLATPKEGRNADHEFTDAVKNWKPIPDAILTVDPPSTKDDVIALMEQLANHVNAAMETSERLVEAKRRRVERVEEMLKEEDDIDTLLERKVSFLGMLVSDKDKNSTEEKVLLGHILDLIDY